MPTSGVHSWKSILRTGNRFRNLPKDEVGHEILLPDFEAMPEKNMKAWRDHLVDSFTPGSHYAPKFRFLTKEGLPPKLSMVQIKSQQSDSPIRKKHLKWQRAKSTKGGTDKSRGWQKKVVSGEMISDAGSPDSGDENAIQPVKKDNRH